MDRFFSNHSIAWRGLMANRKTVLLLVTYKAKHCAWVIYICIYFKIGRSTKRFVFYEFSWTFLFKNISSFLPWTYNNHLYIYIISWECWSSVNHYVVMCRTKCNIYIYIYIYINIINIIIYNIAEIKSLNIHKYWPHISISHLFLRYISDNSVIYDFHTNPLA